jgi:N-acetyl-1-D-myo-inositol-2-amino-2-deoxy-alpha-D-glucopyranoside deacetylase
LPAALFAALAGTLLHRQEAMLGGIALPWGAVAALALLASVEVLLAAAFRSIIPTALCGAACYALTGWWSTLQPGRRLIIGDLAGNLWIFGIAADTVGVLVWCRRRARGG